MNHRNVSLIDNLAVAANRVEIYNLKGLDPISEIVVQYRGPNGAAVPLAHPARLIQRVQIVDGSEVLVDLSGDQIAALGYYHYKSMPHSLNVYVNTIWCGTTLRIPFGRWLWDQELALDPARFKNLQVIITVNILGGGSGPVPGTLEVMANMFDQKKVNPRGYLTAREHFRYLAVALGVQTIDLPTDRVIKMLLFQGDAAAIPLIQQMNRIRIDEDNDKHIFLDNNVSDILMNMSPDLPTIDEQVYFAGIIGNISCFVTPYFEPYGTVSGTDAVNNWGQVLDQGGGQIRFTMAAVGNAKGSIHGIAPHGVVGIEFGDPWDIDDWYNPSQIKQLRARITAGTPVGVASTNKVIVQQLKNY